MLAGASLALYQYTVLFLVRSRSLTQPVQLAFAGWFLASLGGLGGVLEGRRWGPVVEAVRLVTAPLMVAAATSGP